MRKISEQINLSAREKRMLYFLLCFLLVMGGWFFLLKPQLDKGNELNLELLDTQIEHDNLQLKLLEYQNAPIQLEQVRAEIKTIISKYNPYYVNEDIDRIVTTLFLQHGLEPKSLSIETPEPIKIDDTDSIVDALPVRMVVTGQFYQMTAALDGLQSLTGIKVADFSYSAPTDSTQIPTASYSIMIYMTEQ